MNNNNPIVDLSWGLEEGMLTYPTKSHQRFEASIMGRIAVEGRETRRFTMGSHCGTHIDAMRHFLPDGLTIDRIPLEQLTGPAFLVNLGELAPGTLIEEGLISRHLPEEPVDRLVLRTDWSRFWHTGQFYKDWPCLSASCTEFLMERKIRLLGIDFPSPDPAYFGNDCNLDCPNHKRLFSRNIVLVEYLTNLSKLKAGRIHLMVLPLKLIGFDGAPARAAAYSLEK